MDEKGALPPQLLIKARKTSCTFAPPLPAFQQWLGEKKGSIKCGFKGSRKVKLLSVSYSGSLHLHSPSLKRSRIDILL